MRRLLAQVRRQGYATGDREYQRTTRTLAVPIMANAVPVASLNIMVVPGAMSMEQLVKSLLPALGAATYNLAKASPCPLRFQVAAEAGWDVGCICSCLIAAGLLAAGVSLAIVMLVALPALALAALLLRRYYGSRAPG